MLCHKRCMAYIKTPLINWERQNMSISIATPISDAHANKPLLKIPHLTPTNSDSLMPKRSPSISYSYP